MAIKQDAARKSLWQSYKNSGVPQGDVVGWGQQRSNLESTYKDTRSLLKLERIRAANATRQQIGALRDQRSADVSSAAAAANDRGVLGSSVDVSTRARVKADSAQQIIAARDALTQARDDNIAQLMQARSSFYTGNANLDALIAASKATAATTNYVEGAFDQGGGGGGGGGIPAGAGITKAVESANSFPQLLRNLEAIGFRAGETGVRGYGGVDPNAGHDPQGGHFASPKRTADINFGPGGESALEKRKLARLYSALKAAGVPIKQALYPGNEPDEHSDHMHLQVLLKRWFEKQRAATNSGTGGGGTARPI